LLPLQLDQAFVDAIASDIPELPDEKRARFEAEYGLSTYDAGVLVAEKETGDFFEAVAKGRDAKLAANWVMGELFGALNKAGVELANSPVSADALGGLIEAIASDTISGRTAKDVFATMFETGKSADTIIDEQGLKQISDEGSIEAALDEIIAANPAQVEKAKENPKLKGWFVGQVMKATGGQANPGVVNKLINQKLG